MSDWGAGRYETTAAELAPVAEVVVQRAGVGPGDVVADLACGTGNAALAEIARILRPAGRAFVTAWIPAGPIDAMLGAVGRIMARVAPGDRAPRFAWSDPDAVGPVARDAGLVLAGTERAELAIRAASPDAYVDAGAEHPMALAMRPALDRAGVAEEAREAMVAVLRDANEDAAGFLVHSPYVIHELRRAG